MNIAIFNFTAAISAGFIVLPAATATASGSRSAIPGGFYIGTETGVALASNLESTRTNMGIPTNCDNQWKPLRGHGSTVGPPGGPGGNLPVRYRITAADLDFLGIGLGLNHSF